MFTYLSNVLKKFVRMFTLFFDPLLAYRIVDTAHICSLQASSVYNYDLLISCYLDVCQPIPLVDLHDGQPLLLIRVSGSGLGEVPAPLTKALELVLTYPLSNASVLEDRTFLTRLTDAYVKELNKQIVSSNE